MKLSEAIRLGAMTGPQCFEAFHTWNGATCAMGAAYRAVGISYEFAAIVQPPEWEAFLDRSECCPACEFGATDMQGIIFHLNDEHKWTREAIADFVEQIERAAEQTPQESELTTA